MNRFSYVRAADVDQAMHEIASDPPPN